MYHGESSRREECALYSKSSVEEKKRGKGNQTVSGTVKNKQNITEKECRTVPSGVGIL